MLFDEQTYEGASLIPIGSSSQKGKFYPIIARESPTLIFFLIF